MTRIEEALKKLRGQPQPTAPGLARAEILQSGQTASRKEKVVVAGGKHHVSTEELMASGLLVPVDQAVTVADDFRKIKRPLIANAMRTGPEGAPHQNVIMIASGSPGAGKTFCSVNLAVSMSFERELNVLLVDADVAKPHISEVFGLSDAPGLIDLLLDPKIAIADVLVRTDLNDIQILPAGRKHPQATELLASERMSAVVKELSTRYSDRIVVVDSPPLLATSEAQALAEHVGQIVVVVEAGETSQQSLHQTLETLNPEKSVNIVLNKIRRWGKAHYYGYGYGAYTYSGHEAR